MREIKTLKLNEQNTARLNDVGDGWIWIDQFGKDYGPWPTKDMAEVLGPDHAAKEEKLLRMVNQ